MLNYIWAGLIILSLVFALSHDIRDLSRDTYRNGEALSIRLDFHEGYSADQRRVPVQVHLPPAEFMSLYGVDTRPDSIYGGVLVQTAEGSQLRFAQGASLPEPLATIRTETSADDEDLRGNISTLIFAGNNTSTATTSITFEPVRFIKLNAISSAALAFAETAVTLALGLIGALALWMGLLAIAEASGMLLSIVRFTQPVVRRLFPEIPKDHPALGLIVLNLTANMLGLGNAATPLGLKAMEELQKLNPTEDTATNSMVMLLAINTASVQLVPPVLLVAIMGLQINELMVSIILVTFLGTAVAIASAKLLGRLKRYRADDPGNKQPQTEG